MDSREKMLTEALDLFRSKGSAHTSIADVADAAGIAKGTLYYYFPSKDSLVQAAVDMAMERLSVAVPTFSADMQIAEVFLLLIEVMKMENVVNSFMFLLDESIHSTTFRERYRDTLQGWQIWWKGILETKGYTNSEELAVLCSCIVGGLAIQLLIDSDAISSSELGTCLKEVFPL